MILNPTLSARPGARGPRSPAPTLTTVAQDLRLLDDWVQESSWPHTDCPVCGAGSLTPDSIVSVEAAASSRHHDHEAWEPEWIHGTFHGVLRCSVGRCNEPVSIAGDYKVDMVMAPGGGWYGEYEAFYRLRYALPALPLLAPPDKTPETVRRAVEAASALLWIDPGAAGNRLRFAIEELLTAQRVRRSIMKDGKRIRLTTHRRIELLRQRKEAASDALMAVKWIGNEGSHADALTATDVIDGAELLGHALRLLYDDSAKQMERRIRKINKAKGLPRNRPRPR